MHEIRYGKLSAMLLDFVDHGDGFLFLRLVGPEPVVNAIWAKLSARNPRGKKWSSPVQIPIPGRGYPEYVASQKQVRYRTLRTRLHNGMVDLAMIHPCLTVSEDSEAGFFLLTYASDVPESFFARLNRCLSIPLKEEWAGWLWDNGQQPQSWLAVESQEETENGETVERQHLVQTSQTPIERYQSYGQVACYRIRTGGDYKTAWLQIIRQQLKLGIPLWATQGGAGQRYEEALWSVYAEHANRWVLDYGDEQVLSAPSLDFLLAKARQELGRYFILPEQGR